MSSAHDLPPAPTSAPSGGQDVGKERLRSWQAATERPLTAVSLLFLLAYALPIAFPDLGPDARSACTWVLRATWVVFVADYVVRVRLAPRTWWYVRHHPLELAVVILPALRPLLLLSVLMRLNRANAVRLRGRVVRFAVAGTTLLVLTGALAVTQAERGAPGANIVNLGDGFWWTMVTIATVGYGDYAPVTAVGRVIAVGLMLGGVALLGVVTATLSSWMVERVTRSADVDQSAEGTDLDAGDVTLGLVASPEQIVLLTAEVQTLRAEIVDWREREEERQRREDPGTD